MNEKKKETGKRKLYALLSDELYVPMKAREIAMLLDMPKSRRKELKELPDSLVEDGKVRVTKKGKYKISTEEVLEGVFTAHKNGFGFVTVEGCDTDFFIPREHVNKAFHRDTVKIMLLPEAPGKRREARVVDVISHDINIIVGTFMMGKKNGTVVCDDKKLGKEIKIPAGKDSGAMSGQKVVVKLLSYGSEKTAPTGEVAEIIGFQNDPGTDILSVVKGMEIPTEFPDRVKSEAETVAKKVTSSLIKKRHDLRKLTMVTIDGEESKDLDDAVSLEEDGENYILGVHIADVSHYVKEKSELDKEALKRGTSIYLADRVIPMLPQTLSNGICSLNAG